MRWEDERYVRVYTRDTVTWLSLPWEARALLLFVFRKCDRAGLIELGEDGIAGLAVLVGMPLAVVETAIAELLAGKDPPLQLRGSTLLAPHFLEAQEAHASPKARANVYRERLRARNAVETPRDSSSHDVTHRDTGSGDALGRNEVTPRDADTTSRPNGVTSRDGLSTPSRADLAVPSVPRIDPDLEIDPKEEDRSAASPRAEELQVFEHWTKARSKRDPKLTDDRRRKIRARLREGYTVEQLLKAIDGVARDPWEERRLHDDLTVILRDGSHVEKFLALAGVTTTAPKTASGNGSLPRTPRAYPTVEETNRKLAEDRIREEQAVRDPAAIRALTSKIGRPL